MTHEDNGVPVEDRRGRGGDEKSRATQDTKGVATEQGGNMESGPGPAAQPRPQQDRTASVIRGDKDEQHQMSMHRHFFSITGARHKRGARRKYIKLAL